MPPSYARTRGRQLALTVLAASAVLAAALAPSDGPAQSSRSPRKKVLVELFTSQG